MERKVAVIHTTVVTCDGINSRLKALVPDAEVMNIVDDSLLNDVKKEGMLTKEVTRRLLTYALEAQDWGAELILNACSSVGEGVDVIRLLLKIPYLKIDEPMARSAVEKGEKIAVYGTVKTTLEPSARLISHIAEAEKKKVVVDSYLASDAFEALTVEKNQEKHNQILEALIRDTGKQYDVLVLAQASMSVLIPCLADITKPILSSMDSGVEAAAKALKGL
ncbi:Asp/Glu/hydantoin racemase [Enterocloster bolteae]|nr:Asp/Glu/hydantoin racemase [Enterocloster bolteae]